MEGDTADADAGGELVRLSILLCPRRNVRWWDGLYGNAGLDGTHCVTKQGSGVIKGES